ERRQGLSLTHRDPGGASGEVLYGGRLPPELCRAKPLESIHSQRLRSQGGKAEEALPGLRPPQEIMNRWDIPGACRPFVCCWRRAKPLAPPLTRRHQPDLQRYFTCLFNRFQL